MSPSGAVFLSYASQDAEAARRICETLRADGIEVWFDQNELVGGDAWDQKIRRQIKECALFVPIISANTQARREGYFRIEWKLAAQRTHAIADGTPFLLPVVIDATHDADALVPEEFRAVQWTRLPDGEAHAAFRARVRKVVVAAEIEPGRPQTSERNERVASTATSQAKRRGVPVGVWLALIVGIGTALYVSFRQHPAPAAPPVAAAKSVPAVLVPAATNAKSIAVLPFENFSPDPANAFFADGMHDEVITALAKIHDLTVTSRTSVMAYRKTEGRNLRKIAAELGVAHVLEGSVQRAGNKAKVIVQLIDARNDAHLWAETYTEDLTDVFTIQAKLAAAITTALQATFSPEEKLVLAQRPTKSQEAYDLYLRARQMNDGLTSAASRERWDAAIRVLDEAVALDPAFVPALAMRAILHQRMYWFGNVDPSPARLAFCQTTLAALQAVAPNAPETVLAEGYIALNRNLDFSTALSHYEIALRGLPNWDFLLRLTGWTRFNLGKFDEGIADCRRSQALNPADLQSVGNLTAINFALRRFEACVAADGPLLDKTLLTYGNGGDTIERARFELSGDRETLVRNLIALATRNPRAQLQAAYESALLRGDLSRAASVLAENPADTLTWNGASVEPARLNQALIARLLGRPTEAAAFAEQATAILREQVNSFRLNNFVRVMLIRAAAYGGRDDEALRLAKVAQQELTPARIGVADGALVLHELGRLYALLGAREDAFACLRALTSGPSAPAGFGTPRLLRLDPCWSRLKDDPRFEEYLKAAKPL